MAHKKQKRTNPLGVVAVTAAVIVLIAAFVVHTVSLKQSEKEYIRQMDELKVQIAKEQEQQAQLESEYDYVQSDQYVEDEARSRFDLVYPGDTLVKPAE